MFQYEIKDNHLTIEELLRTNWRLGKKLVHELRMEKAVTSLEGEPLQWKDPLPAGTIIKFSFPIPASSYS